MRATFLHQWGCVNLLENIKNAIHLRVDELCASAAVDELTNDTEAYRAKLEALGIVAKALGINTEITSVTINIVDDPTE